ncbi:MFS transporter [Microbacterium sp. Sa4CUA7]|uniref:MFS transporter n=2 Tax=Microbacterium pullorum TaxID=2762236 RepID=A0ABR8S2N2_9MICO|nr:MFS transporter [Microbacterium pullorum]
MVPVASAAPTLSRVGAGFIWGLILASFGVNMAYIVPLAFSLSLKLNELAPGQEELLGVITGSGAVVALVTAPLLGMLSDRTRSRFGRRRPFMLGGLVIGLVSLFVMATAPSLPILIVGWMLAMLGWGTATGALLNVQADRLPEEQRGKVAGLNGFASMIAPTVGVVIAGAVASSLFLVFLIPGIVGGLFLLAFAIFFKDADSRAFEHAPMTLGGVVSKYVFNPKTYPAFAWNWLGRFFFFAGLSFSTTFTAFFFAQRLGIPLEEIAGVIGMVALLGMVATVIGSIGGGFLSDRLKRRRVFILVSAIAFVGGALISAVAWDLTLIIVGSLLINFAIGCFSAVDQAIVLDVLPNRETEAGRFLALMGFAQQIPGVIAPVFAGLIITIGATAGEKNYALAYIVSGALVLLGAAVIFLKVKVVR